MHINNIKLYFFLFRLWRWCPMYEVKWPTFMFGSKYIIFCWQYCLVGLKCFARDTRDKWGMRVGRFQGLEGLTNTSDQQAIIGHPTWWPSPASGNCSKIKRIKKKTRTCTHFIQTCFLLAIYFFKVNSF